MIGNTPCLWCLGFCLMWVLCQNRFPWNWMKYFLTPETCAVESVRRKRPRPLYPTLGPLTWPSQCPRLLITGHRQFMLRMNHCTSVNHHFPLHLPVYSFPFGSFGNFVRNGLICGEVPDQKSWSQTVFQIVFEIVFRNNLYQFNECPLSWFSLHVARLSNDYQILTRCFLTFAKYTCIDTQTDV